ncbi:hypothetical protein [Micromonospora rifamycinica]|uniref:Uncharacterized protein n=1 Tax=Micromonospora rifamycinica TaxID=291594 RepID=A0A125Q1D3_9ACTN|nr:hypothetical protein [Micromonospora rifamycinica]KWV31820.1 hypothetical protein AWV63_15515 [Micromonospora rifamycinica]SCG75419.1 hypothetical protein GA0070623_3997 [Micromonospora rifamycinica]
MSGHAGTDQVTAPAGVPDFDPDRQVQVPSLSFLPEGDGVVVGNAAADSYAVLPVDGAELLRRLSEGMTPRAAAAWYADTYGEEVDIAELLVDLAELGLVTLPDTTGPTTTSAPAAASAPVRWQRLGRALFSPVALLAYAALVVAAVVVAVAQPDLRPHYRAIFFTDYLTVVTIVLAVGQWPLIALHESAHALAGRRLGLRSRLTIGYRLQYLVFETVMDGLVTVPRRQRWVPMLAGIGVDLVVMALLTLAAAALREPDGSLPLPARLCLALSFGALLRVAWQFFLYLRTDLYYLLTLVLGTVDLHGSASVLLRHRFRRLTGRPGLDRQVARLHPTDRRTARWYSWLMVAGYAATLATLAFAIVPAGIHFFVEAVAELDGRHGVDNLVDSAVVLVLSAAELAFVGYLALRTRRRARTAPA